MPTWKEVKEANEQPKRPRADSAVVVVDEDEVELCVLCRRWVKCDDYEFHCRRRRHYWNIINQIQIERGDPSFGAPYEWA